jgi:ribosomal protein S1
VKEVDPEKGRISLSIKMADPNFVKKPTPQAVAPEKKPLSEIDEILK